MHLLQEGDLIALGPTPEAGCLEIVHTPGHSPDSISLWDSQVRAQHARAPRGKSLTIAGNALAVT